VRHPRDLRDVADGGTSALGRENHALTLYPAPVTGPSRIAAAPDRAFAQYPEMFPQALAFVAIFLRLLTLGEVFPVLGSTRRSPSSASTSAVRWA